MFLLGSRSDLDLVLVEMITIQSVFSDASCSDHPITCVTEEELDGATTLIAGGRCNCTEMNEDYNTCRSYCDTESFALGRLADGRYLVVEESSDSSGHG
jgi:hypothetical protein